MSLPNTFAIKTSHYIIGGFSLVVALAWNSSIRQAIERKFPLPDDSVKASLIYALCVTLMLILIIYFLPDTKSELPDSTQKLIQQEEERYAIKRKIDKLERAIKI